MRIRDTPDQNFLDLLRPRAIPKTILLPCPTHQLRRIHTRLKRLAPRIDLLVQQRLPRGRSTIVKVRHSINSINGQTETIRLVANC